jgi:hypothetical protein
MSQQPLDVLPPDVIEAHPPERGPRRKQYVVLYSCCCCCCCCLHTIGGAVGAAVAAVNGNYRPLEKPFEPRRRMPSSQALYWFSVIVATALTWVCTTLYAAAEMGSLASAPLTGLYITGVALILIGPIWLLAGSIVMALRLTFSRRLRDDRGYWKSLGRITLGGVIGTAVGCGIMFGLFVLFAGLG